MSISLIKRFITIKMPKGSFYAVRTGKKPGVYLSWSECEKQVKGVPGCRYKKFETQHEANDFVNGKDIKNLRKFNTFTKNSEVSNQLPRNAQVKRKIETEETSSKVPKLDLDIDKDSVHIYTDGACTNNGTKDASAGIGIYWGENHPLNTSKKLMGRPTNNRAEIHAAIWALKQAKEHGHKNITLYTDSQFLINGTTKWIKGWIKRDWKLSTGQPVINKEDFEELEVAKKDLNIKWMYVKGHKGIHGNEMADKLAVAGIHAAD